MFEAAELGRKLDKKTYAAELPAVREALLDAQFRFRDADFSVAMVIAGAEGAGKGETVHALLEWLDAHGIETHALSKPSDEELARPTYYRFWRRLPPQGKIAIFFGSWYTDPIVQRIDGLIDENKFEHDMHRIVEFERMLASENTLLIKIWLHITKHQQKRVLKRLHKNPDTAWRVTERDWAYHKTYDEFIKVSGSTIGFTSKPHAPWHIVESADRRHRNMDVALYLLDRLEHRLSEPRKSDPVAESLPVPAKVNVVNTLKLNRSIDRGKYETSLEKWQGRLGQLARHMTEQDLAVAMVFEGSDGAGKGGCIRRVVHALDERYYQVIPVAAPTDEELARPYLWRFWRRLPGKGCINIYDRSWYGRVLVERIEGFCQPDDWKRAYAEINAFEQELSEERILVIKFWLSISDDEQLKRFKLREETGYKRYKLTEEDWRNRDKAPAYEAAACDMIARTSTPYSPWTLVEANNKRFARVKVLKTICKRLNEVLDKVTQKKRKK